MLFHYCFLMSDVFKPIFDILSPITNALNSYIQTGQTGIGEFYARFIMWIILFSILKIVLDTVLSKVNSSSDNKTPRNVIAGALSILGVVGIPSFAVRMIFTTYSAIAFIAAIGFLMYLLFVANKKLEEQFGANKFVSLIVYSIATMMLFLSQSVIAKSFPDLKNTSDTIFSILIPIMTIMIMITIGRMMGEFGQSAAGREDVKWRGIGRRIFNKISSTGKSLGESVGSGIRTLRKFSGSPNVKNLLTEMGRDFTSIPQKDLEGFLRHIYAVGDFLTVGTNLYSEYSRDESRIVVIEKKYVDRLEKANSKLPSLIKKMSAGISRLEESAGKQNLTQKIDDLNSVLSDLSIKKRLNNLKKTGKSQSGYIVNKVTYGWNDFDKINSAIKGISEIYHVFYENYNFIKNKSKEVTSEFGIIMDLDEIDEESKGLLKNFQNRKEIFESIGKLRSSAITNFKTLFEDHRDFIANKFTDSLIRDVRDWISSPDYVLDDKLIETHKRVLDFFSKQDKELNSMIKSVKKGANPEGAKTIEQIHALLSSIAKDLESIYSKEADLVAKYDSEMKAYYKSMINICANFSSNSSIITNESFVGSLNKEASGMLELKQFLEKELENFNGKSVRTNTLDEEQVITYIRNILGYK